MKEKLIEMICEGRSKCAYRTCENCPEIFSGQCMDKLLADHLIANGVTIQKWIPVTERLPKANKLVLCWWQSGDGEREHYGFATYQHHGVWYVSNEGMPKVTHWMPLPEAPKEVDNES